MSELRDPTRATLAAAVKALVKRHGGPTEVGEVVGAHRLTVTRWMKGDIGIDKLGLLAEKLGESITVHFGPGTQEEAAPSMTRRLLAGVMALEKEAGIDEAVIERMTEKVDEMEALARGFDPRIAEPLTDTPQPDDEGTAGQGDGQSVGSQGSTRRKP